MIMKYTVLPLLILLGLWAFAFIDKNQTANKEAEALYLQNRAPLIQKPYMELPLGSIRAKGWLQDQLQRQAVGMTGQLDELYPLVMGKRNGWLGGDGDQWERGPYWIDGLLPLAYLLDDELLKAKVKPWIEWSLNNQRVDGYFGPKIPDQEYPYEQGIQRDNIADWWPKMVMLKVLQQHYSATGDQRVIDLMTNYFKYQLEELPENPLGHWTFWGNRRGGDNLLVVYWLYNITGDRFLLDLAELIHEQTYNWTDTFLHGSEMATVGSMHCVNVAQGIKEPVIYYQQSLDSTHVQAVQKGLKDLMTNNGHPHGLYGGDEWLHGTDPTQGSEFCTAVEMMYSLENMLAITGDLDFAQRLERIAFNALPTQATDDYMERQYFQQANQVSINRQLRNFVNPNGGTVTNFGLLTGYPCCTSNMHQGWPKFTQNLWYATPDNGLAALIYSPCEVTAQVAGGETVTLLEETNYPFEESIRFHLTKSSHKKLAFPFTLAIPKWCEKGVVKINGKDFVSAKGGETVTLNRTWKIGDQVELVLPMKINTQEWHERSVSVERGPLVYALKMEEKWEKVENKKDPVWYGDTYYNVSSDSPWNYGLLKVHQDPLAPAMKFESKEGKEGAYPWNLDNNTLEIKVKAKKIPRWKEYNGMTGPMIFSPSVEENKEVEEITLVPYGCTTLRVSAFPVVW